MGKQLPQGLLFFKLNDVGIGRNVLEPLGEACDMEPLGEACDTTDGLAEVTTDFMELIDSVSNSTFFFSWIELTED